jgi:hypothetical protein
MRILPRHAIVRMIVSLAFLLPDQHRLAIFINRDNFKKVAGEWNYKWITNAHPIRDIPW